MIKDTPVFDSSAEVTEFISKKESEEKALVIQFATEILKCELQKKMISDTIKDIKTDAKSDGIAVKLVMSALKTMKRLMKENGEGELDEEEVYLDALRSDPMVQKLMLDLSNE